MKHTMQKSCYGVVVALALAFLANSPLIAQTATFDLTGLGSQLSLAGVYTSPYTGTINGGSPISVICDDFADNAFVPEEWTANVTSLSSIIADTNTPSNLRWNGASSDNLTQAQAYTVAAILSIDILQSNPLGAGGSAAQIQAQEDYSYALWELFDPTVSVGQTNSTSGVAPTDAVEPWLSGDPTDLGHAKADLNTAIGQLSSSSTILSNYNVTIYSYAGGGVWGCGGCAPPPQEFITVSMAEPPSLAVFAVYFLLGGGGFLYWGRRRILRANS